MKHQSTTWLTSCQRFVPPALLTAQRQHLTRASWPPGPRGASLLPSWEHPHVTPSLLILLAGNQPLPLPERLPNPHIDKGKQPRVALAALIQMEMGDRNMASQPVQTPESLDWEHWV